MPQFSCRALTPQGQVVKSIVEDSSRLACIRKLRKNGLTPIVVKQFRAVSILAPKKNAVKKARNIKPTNINSGVNKRTSKKSKTKKPQGGIWDMLNSDIGGGKKISSRDIRVFCQNFYLLKKANFNNIHALSTVIGTTENSRLKLILEDILAGVEGRRIYVYYNGILFKRISIYIYKYDKSW